MAAPPKWVTVPEAAAMLGLSPSGFRLLARREGITIVRRGRQPGVLVADVVRYREAARVRPASTR